MPVKKTKITKGPNKGKYRVSTPSGVKAKAATKANAEAQTRVLNAVEHGWKPSKKKVKSKRRKA